MVGLESSFNGERLKAARLYNMMTMGDVAEAIGVSTKAISQFENNKAEPKTENIFGLANLLGFPRSFFYEEDTKCIICGNTYFRSLASTTQKCRKSQIEKVKLLGYIYEGIEKYIRFPNFCLKSQNSLDIESLAGYVREKWGLGDGPILNIIDVMERNGIIIASTFEENESIDAYSQVEVIDKKIVPVVVLGYEKNGFRQQFNAAHELGHILTDGMFELEDMSKLEYRDMENTMNRFAGALLIPKNMFLKDLYSKNKTDFNFYIKLKKKYRVSAAALVVRAHQLGAITTNQYQYVMKQRSYGGYVKEEPLDRDLPTFKPRYLKQALKMIIEDNSISGDKFMDSINISLHKSMVEKILGLEDGYLGRLEAPAPISLLNRI